MNLIRHTGIFVKNLEEMKDFYMKNFDMNIAVHDTEVGDYISSLYGKDGSEIEVELYKLITVDGCMIELLKIKSENDEDVHSNQVYFGGCCHIAFTVVDVDDLYSRLTREGVEFYSKPLLSRDKMHKVCFCRDPEGNYLELVEDL